MNDKITLTAIIGAVLITGMAIFMYGASGKEITAQAITGLLGFAGGGAVGYTVAKKDGE